MQQIFGEGITFFRCINWSGSFSFSVHGVMFVALLFSGEGPLGMQVYADLFKENHITGKRLLLLTEVDMRDMGVKSKGHAMHLKADIHVDHPHLRRCDGV